MQANCGNDLLNLVGCLQCKCSFTEAASKWITVHPFSMQQAMDYGTVNAHSNSPAACYGLWTMDHGLSTIFRNFK